MRSAAWSPHCTSTAQVLLSSTYTENGIELDAIVDEDLVRQIDVSM
ncbi:MAG: hypothetical protein ACLUFI_10480 [Oscillospiraceae bacterium]